MQAKTIASFALGFGFGAVLVTAALWQSGAMRLRPAAVRETPPVSAPVPAGPPLLPDLNAKLPSPKVEIPRDVPQIQRQSEAERVAPDTDRRLLVPVQGVSVSDLHDTFSETRGGSRQHEAIDIMAPRGTPVIAADDGNVVKLFTSKPGGLTVYQFDNSRTYCYYYAHLDRYAPGLQEGMLLHRGDVLGYVGNSGDAAGGPTHLHFAVTRLGAEKNWWQGTPINPFPLLTGTNGATGGSSQPPRR